MVAPFLFQLKNTLTKNEKLKSRKAIGQLFKTGKRLKGYPVGVSYLFSDNIEEESTIRILVSVPKRSVKKAVHRNRIKRQMREAYRTQKHDVLAMVKAQAKVLHLAFVYQCDHSSDFTVISEKIKQHLSRLQEELEDKK